MTPLVGLWNRRVFHDRLAEMVQPGAELGVLFIDIDDFKSVNDSLGHAAGDTVLGELARRIGDVLRPTDLAARLGGDEFGIALPGCASPEAVRPIAERLLAMLEMPIAIDGRALKITASVGAATTRDSTDAAALMRDADIAMYQAKRLGKNRVEFYEQGAHEDAALRLRLRTDLEGALAAGQFALVYQPIVELASNRVVGAEALLRWDHPERGRLLPADFLATVEELGLIVPIGRWVVQEACRQLAHWQAELRMRDLFVSVNLSPLQLRDPALADDIEWAIADAGIRPSDLTIEVTESVVLDAASTAGVLERLRADGIRIALDDFGTGFATLSNLARVPLSMIKVDRSFVAALADGSREAAIVENLLHIAASLGLEPVAEGIEESDQRQRLVDMGCRLGQGFLMGFPAEANAVTQLISQGRASGGSERGALLVGAAAPQPRPV
jgi:diguanylate cyclase (GGDEF)-like protein